MRMDRDCLEDGLTNEDRCFLCAMPTMAEVREVVFCIEPESVAGPDGFGAIFYHTCWDLVLEDVFCAVSKFFHGIAMPKSFIATTISLIPKTVSPASWSEYRPISLCNVTNKICTKLMSIRLGHVLAKVLSPSQSGFVPRRLLSDNVLLAQELVHSLESRQAEANVIFKLDMAKAYYRGDPLCLALFVLVADYLSQGLDRLFAVRLTMYYQSPGRVRAGTVVTVARGKTRYRLPVEIFSVTYLGVPLYKGNWKACLFDSLISRLHDMLQGWAMMNLSHGGRLALIRSMLQATPLHLLQVIHPPKSVLITTKLISNGFFWGSYNGRRHIHWSSWDKMCSPVAEGGFGIRSFAKLKSSLWLEFLHDRYYRTLHPTHVPDEAEPLIFWTLGQAQCLSGMIIDLDSLATDCACYLLNSYCSGTEGQNCVDRDIWHRSLRPTVFVFLWWLFQDWILVDERMKEKGFSFPSKCQCCEAEERISHLFVEGAVVRDVWLRLANVFGLQLCETGDLLRMVHFYEMLQNIMGYILRPRASYWRFSASSAHCMLHSHDEHTVEGGLALGVGWRFLLQADGGSGTQNGALDYPHSSVVQAEFGWVLAREPRASSSDRHYSRCNWTGDIACQFALGTATSVVQELTDVWRGLELARAHSLARIVVEVDVTIVLHLLQSRVSGMLEDVASRQLTQVMYQEDIMEYSETLSDLMNWALLTFAGELE
ncbi:UNVERIFIED_CONTAM: hypothetical protein Sindi_1780000 [Sesamum indicum]